MNSFFHRTIHKGFTIIELLVVVAIIGILASVVVAMFSQPKADSRDARRESDMKQIQNALALYISTNGTYPDCQSPTVIDGSSDCLSAKLLDARAMPQVPMDPQGRGACPAIPPVADGFGYCYISNPTGSDYAIYYHREDASGGAGLSVGSGWYRINP